jgi:hypothetical protein
MRTPQQQRQQQLQHLRQNNSHIQASNLNESTSSNHNLNIHMYSLKEILGLFGLTHDISLEDLKQAKKQVLMLHPDKSRLPADYFLFYKKAFDIVVNIYENINKQNAEVPTTQVDYQPYKSEMNKATVNKVTSVIKDMKTSEFQDKFNKLFEENMAQKIDAEKYSWFSKDEPVFQTNEKVSTKNMGQVFDKIKQTQNGLVQYRGVQEMASSNRGNSLYDDDSSNGYVTSDPFSKLKFDDLRKVHKDQTVFSVSERDYDKVQQYTSVDHYVRERGKHSTAPLAKDEAERILSMKDQQYRERLLQQEHAANLRTMEYEKKNKAVLASFMYLENGK